MKKIFLGLWIILLSLWSVFAYTPSAELTQKLGIVNSKIDQIIEIKGEWYKQNFISALEKYKVKYSWNDRNIYIINSLLNNLTKDSNSELSKAPNILLVIADDMWLDASPWYSDYTWQKPKTPVLDSLADDWLVFDNVWSNPLCSPTRATILTWKYWVHTGVLWALWKNDAWVSTDEYSLQKMITEKSKAWYEQAVIGKWHLATNNNWSENNPELMWVPYYSGFLWWSMKDYNSWQKTTNGISSQSKTYATTEFTSDSISWVDQNQDEPWFLWLAYTAPHTPFHIPPAELLSDETNDTLNSLDWDIEGNPLPYYLAAIEAMDTEIGRLLENLPDEERKNTIVVFIGDNWTPNQVAQTPFSKSTAKWSISRGWVHVPMFVSWMWVDSWRAEEFVNTSDLYTTIAELTGIILPTYWNSISFAPVLFWKEREVERDYLYAEVASASPNGWPSNKNGWTIRKDWYQFISLDSWTEKLFADSDLGQTNNLIKSKSSIASELRELWISVRGWETAWEYGQYPTNTDDIVCHDYFSNSTSEYTAVPEGEESNSTTLTYPIVDTWLTTFYSENAVISTPSIGSDFYWQDSQYQIHTPSYTNNNNGTTTDNITGLVWEQDMWEKMTYEEAMQKAEKSTLGWYTDWRVADIKELYSLIQFTGTVSWEKALTMFIDEDYFEQPLWDTSKGEREIDAQTWSSTQYVWTTMNGDATVFWVNFVDGRIKWYPTFNKKTNSDNSMYFRLVRWNTSYWINNFSDNGNNTITDNATGLMWAKNDSQKWWDWEDSLAYCEGLTLANHSDWRLPNAKELQSIVDYTKSPQTTNSAAIDWLFNVSTITDPEWGMNYPFYWTSSTHLDWRVPESNGVYIAFGEAQWQMRNTLMDVHGAWAQRSDPKSWDANNYPEYFWPQWDVRYVYNYARCVRSTDKVDNTTITTSNITPPKTNTSSSSSTATSTNNTQTTTSQNATWPVKAIAACEDKNIWNSCSFTNPKGSITWTCKDTPKFGKVCVEN